MEKMPVLREERKPNKSRTQSVGGPALQMQGVWQSIHDRPETQGVSGGSEEAGDENIFLRSQRTRGRKDIWHEQIQCDELDKKRAQKMMWKSGKSRTIWRRQNWMNCTGF